VRRTLALAKRPSRDRLQVHADHHHVKILERPGDEAGDRARQ
jgi:hypothetical protein